MELTKEEAIKIAEKIKEKHLSYETLFLFQINQEKLCCDFSDFHKATEKALKRGVMTHEFTNPKSLLNEFFGIKNKPDLKEVLDMLPKDKTIIAVMKK